MTTSVLIPDDVPTVVRVGVIQVAARMLAGEHPVPIAFMALGPGRLSSLQAVVNTDGGPDAGAKAVWVSALARRLYQLRAVELAVFSEAVPIARGKNRAFRIKMTRAGELGVLLIQWEDRRGDMRLWSAPMFRRVGEVRVGRLAELRIDPRASHGAAARYFDAVGEMIRSN